MDTNGINLLIDNELQEGGAPACVGGKDSKQVAERAALMVQYSEALRELYNYNITRNLKAVRIVTTIQNKQVIMARFEDGKLLVSPVVCLGNYSENFANAMIKAGKLGDKLDVVI